MNDQTSDQNADSDVSSADMGRRRPGEAFYLGMIVLLSFAGAIAFLLMAAYSRFVPAMGISFCFGLAVATLAYAFLGSKSHDQLNMRGFQLGGAAVVVIALIYFTSDPLERQMGVLQKVEVLSKEAQAANERARIAEERASRELIVERGLPQAIAGGGQVGLEDVNTLNGLSEGPHHVNVARANAAHIFETLFRRLDIQSSAEDALSMSEEQWQAFLKGLPDGKRLQLGGIPFARMTIQASDGRIQTVTAFKHDVLTVLGQNDRPEAFLCIRRVMDVRERRSDEAEIVVLAHSRERCR
jgi:hypothetical protein